MTTDPLSAARMQALAATSAGPAGQSAIHSPGTSLRAGIEAASRDFEAMFLAQMLQPMFADLPTDGPFGGGQGEAAFRDLLVTEYAREMSKHTRLGIAEAMTRTLLAAQEGAAQAQEGAAEAGSIPAGASAASAGPPESPVSTSPSDPARGSLP